MMKSVIKARPIEFAKEEDLRAQIEKEQSQEERNGKNSIQQNNWMSSNGESRVSKSNNNISTISRNRSIDPSEV